MCLLLIFFSDNREASPQTCELITNETYACELSFIIDKISSRYREPFFQVIRQILVMESDITSCGICFESYNEGERKPLLLPCSHSFCQNCLQTLESIGKKDCAFCKKSWGQSTFKNFPICYQLIPAGASAQGKPRVETCGSHVKEITFWCATCAIPICNAGFEEKHSKCKFMEIQNYRDGQKEYEKVVNDLLENMSQSNELLSVFKSLDIELRIATEKSLKWRSKSQRKYNKFEEHCSEGSDASTNLPFPQKKKEAQEAFEALNKEAPTDTLLFHVARAYQVLYEIYILLYNAVAIQIEN